MGAQRHQLPRARQTRLRPDRLSTGYLVLGSALIRRALFGIHRQLLDPFSKGQEAPVTDAQLAEWIESYTPICMIGSLKRGAAAPGLKKRSHELCQF
jgi:hypothetical protein